MATSRRGPQVGAWSIPLQSRAGPGQTGFNPDLPVPVNHRVTSASPKISSHQHVSAIGEEDSDSGEDGDTSVTDVETLQASIFCDYAGAGSTSDDAMNDTGVTKIRGLLVAGQSGGAACLICLERVKRTDFVWDCKSGCYAIFHLTCIQSWAGQSLNAAEQRALSRLSEANFPGAAATASHWYCPKCRAAYSHLQIPKEYSCFCEKEVNPAVNPWLAPHTCGERCGRKLEGDCGHECKLLCHPGRCPPCPQLAQACCFCEEKSEVRRCGRRNFSCGGICQKSLPCERHTCESICHGGNCPPCTKTGIYPCRCQTEEALRTCIGSDFQCKRRCRRELSCKKHICEKGCHAGSCGECKLAGRRTCPCGKVEYKGVACDKILPTCGSTCEKVLGCSIHKCQERCHFGPCNSTCRIMLLKACHCGSLKKQVPCHQDLQCERKCQHLRDCTRHACRKRCCNGDCPPCAEVCGRKLRCGNHKCPAPCHRGVCAPCPVSIRISCACGATSFEVVHYWMHPNQHPVTNAFWFEKVPCGMEREQKPPRCSKPCQILPCCSHGANCKPHACHYEKCPPCQLVCNSELSCGHKCPERCHGPGPVPNQEYSLKPKKKKKNVVKDINVLIGVSCPPCLEPIVKQCLGQHYGIERTMMCSAVKDFQCGNLCGNPLSCGNHFCTKPCHPINMIDPGNFTSQMLGHQGAHFSIKGPLMIGHKLYDSCDQCPLQCQKERALCSHPCPLPCHPGDCPSCKVLVKKSCYCDTLVHAFDCDTLSSSSESENAKMLSCGGPCHRKLANCPHMCSDICHPGQCQMASNCRKKVVVRCACQRLKKEWLCLDVQAAGLSRKYNRKEGLRGGLCIGLIPCDQDCLRLVAAKEPLDEVQQLRQRKGSEVPGAAPAPRRRKMCHQTDSQHVQTHWQAVKSSIRRWFIIVVIIIVVFLMMYYGLVGLYELNSWLNRRDAVRVKRSKPHYNSHWQQPL